MDSFGPFWVPMIQNGPELSIIIQNCPKWLCGPKPAIFVRHFLLDTHSKVFGGDQGVFTSSKTMIGLLSFNSYTTLEFPGCQLRWDLIRYLFQDVD